MKTNSNRLLLILLFAIVGMVEVANAFYDPGLQRWINRDPLGDVSNLPLLLVSSDTDGLNDSPEEAGVFTQINRNLFGTLANNPINSIDPLGLTDNSLDACAKSNPGELGKMAAREAHEGRVYAAQKAAEQKAKEALNQKLKEGFGNGLKGSRNIDPSKLKQMLSREELKQAQEIAKQGMRKASELLKKATSPQTRQAAKNAFETQMNRANACGKALGS